MPKALFDERGSISILIIGLFSILLMLSIIMTDISAVYFGQRSLSSSLEASVQRGSKNLDLEKYYQGEYNLNALIHNVVGESEGDPGIPINCEKGFRDVYSTLDSWENLGPEVSRVNLHKIRLNNFECDGFTISISASAVVNLPITLDFLGIDQVSISASAGGNAERKSNNNYSGFDIGR
jgi:hypothetical protein